MSATTAATFEAFFEAVHGSAPFPWQTRLATRVLTEGRWPDLLDLPTGTGKTSAIDVALFALAARPDVFPRRIVLVVDRRVVVDQAATHALDIRTALMAAQDGAAREVARALRALFGGAETEPPFAVSVLRGGMPRDEQWAERPDRPVVALSTVDQVGSRLLFRGYGVSPRMAPLHAGLLGNDTLFLLDEVQLSTAFAETLRALEARWRRWHLRANPAMLPDRWAVVRMSATPLDTGDEAPARLALDTDDRAHPMLSRRLAARKLAALELVKVSGDEAGRARLFAERCAGAARARVVEGAHATAVVVNRVDTARRVYRHLTAETPREFDVALLTGRMRPLDRADIMGDSADATSLAARILAGRLRRHDGRPIVVVATQCIEAGADFDFDALVTECASLDALRQRFGRVDRRGELGESRSTILLRHDQIGEKADDPVYGRAVALTWEWLGAEADAKGPGGVVDFGIAGFPQLPETAGDMAALCSPVVRAPVLLPAYLDAWAQTSPRPEPDPDVSLWLHGPKRGVAEVRIVWRADVDEHQLNGDADETRATAATGRHLAEPDTREIERRRDVAERLRPQLEVCPPSSLEALSVPLPAMRAWLARGPAEPVADVEGTSDANAERREAQGSSARARLCVRYDRGGIEVVGPDAIHPEDTLVVPSSYGGLAAGSWDPEAPTFVRDLGDWAQLVHHGRPVLRLVPANLAGPPVQPADESARWASSFWCPPAAARDVPSIPHVDDSNIDLREAAGLWLDSVRDVAGVRLQQIVRALAPAASRARFRVVEVGGHRIALVGTRRVRVQTPHAPLEDTLGEVLTEDDDSASFAGREVTLQGHLSDVGVLARRFAEQLRLPSDVAEDLALAGALHDIGKADRRFQQMLAGGSEVRLALQREPLAKSTGEARDVASRDRARLRAGYPTGYRHELLSVAMLESSALLDRAHDRNLVLHLVGSHHGWCRPFAPARDPGPSLEVEWVVDGCRLRADAAHHLARLDSGVADRFFDLVERYGWWGLAWLEAILRLADHRASEAAASLGEPVTR